MLPPAIQLTWMPWMRSASVVKMNIEAVIVEHQKLIKLIEQNFAEADTFEFSDDDIDLNLEQEDLSQKR